VGEPNKPLLWNGPVDPKGAEHVTLLPGERFILALKQGTYRSSRFDMCNSFPHFAQQLPLL
jgi:hypothetical protein